MGSRIWVCSLVISIQVLIIASQTNNQDYVALQSLQDIWQNTPPNWVGPDPCGAGWDGIRCNNSRVTSITLASLNLTGQLSGDIQELAELQILDLSYNKGLTGSLPPSIGNLKKLARLILVGCGFSGLIPDTIGSLQQLISLSLNSNNFIGGIPPSIGSLINLYWLDIADNKLSGTIPVSDGNKPGLDMLGHTKHFHFGQNRLSGEIPPRLFNSNMTLIHVLFESNNLIGNIPSTIGLVQTLEVLRLDRNALSGTVPQNLNSNSLLKELYLSNNKLTGALPNLTGLNSLNYMDLSNNSFTASAVPSWVLTLQSLTTLVMERVQLEGQVPVGLFSLPLLQTVILKNNQLNSTLDIGPSYSNKLQLVDLQSNYITDYARRVGYNKELILVGNPICQETGQSQTENYCVIPLQSNYSSYSTPLNNCLPTTCGSNQLSSSNCKCAYPYTGTLTFRAPSFFDLRNLSIYTSLQSSMMGFFQSHQLPVDSVSLSNPTKNSDDYVILDVEIFPSGLNRFNRGGISGVGFVLSSQTFKPPSVFGPFVFHGDGYGNFAGTHKSTSTGVIIGAAVGGSVLVILVLLAGVYAFRQKRRAERADKQNNPFASWNPDKSSGGVPQLKGARFFSFEELKRCTNNFSETNDLGSGGYGKVYRGTLPSGQLVAIKRAQHGSMQGGLEFKTEIELLSRVHHKNVVSLVGFCFEQDEQMLVYEYIPNGTLKESLSGKSGIRLDWMRRLRITLGAARGIQYLHDHANPPIIHRDIKTNNILLDERLTAKVADFGLSKPMDDSEKGHVTTQVKGTMGYMDPEYYMTQQLTEKSDVYSFGVVMLEMITARSPIEKGKYIVREVKQAMDRTKELYNLHGILDPAIGLNSTAPKCLEKYVDLALRCLEETGFLRPAMSEVVKEIENIMELAGLNPNAESASTSASYDEGGKGFDHPYSNESLFDYSGIYPPSKLEPK
ncbi:unnamed protein product [Ilex paraguariensis]|uniref:non-specific serine/threonine protein kinase n=1 Tax=Ilex paraguariensis TaxID=185542 RepID=A0ABC8UDK3_9AQUA